MLWTTALHHPTLQGLWQLENPAAWGEPSVPPESGCLCPAGLVPGACGLTARWAPQPVYGQRSCWGADPEGTRVSQSRWAQAQGSRRLPPWAGRPC